MERLTKKGTRAVELMFDLERTEISPNPYDGPGKSGVPKTVFRALDTSERLASVVQQMLLWRGLTTGQVADEAGVKEADVLTIAQTGKGSMDDVLAVLRCLGIRPVVLPAPLAMAGEEPEP